MHTRAALLTGAGFGAVLLFLFDPAQGRTRRARIRDKMTRTARKTREGLAATAKDVANRSRGVIAHAGRSHADPTAASDRIVDARVRASLGRACSHPKAIETDVIHGHVRLSGPVLASEVDDVISAVTRTRGVVAIENRLEVHEQPGNIPALQNGSTRRWRVLNWSPTTRLIAAAVASTGMALLARSRRRHAAAGFVDYTI